MTDLYPIPQSLTLSLSAIPNGAKRIKPLTRHIVEAAQRVGSIRDDQTLVMAIYTRE